MVGWPENLRNNIGTFEYVWELLILTSLGGRAFTRRQPANLQVSAHCCVSGLREAAGCDSIMYSVRGNGENCILPVARTDLAASQRPRIAVSPSDYITTSCHAEDSRAVLQMPRGNLEVVQPRVLCLAAIAEALQVMSARKRSA